MAATPVETKTIGERNREHFDKAAGSAYDQAWVKALLGQITGFLAERTDWIGLSGGGEIKMLDYACGNGLISQTLAPHVSVVRGIDISGGMVEKYNETAQSRGLYPDRMRAVQGNLLEDPETLNGPEFWDMHLIVMSMALHHVDDPGEMVQKLMKRLRPGGCLVIVDWITPDEETARSLDLFNVAARHTVTRLGFKEEEMKSMFTEAGLVDYSYLLHPEKSQLPEELGGSHQMFWVRGKVPTSAGTS